MIKLIFSLILLSTSIWTGCSGVTTTTTENSVFGKVFNKEGEEAPRTPVKLYRQIDDQWQKFSQTEADKNALYSFDHLPDGKYQILVDLKNEEGSISEEISLEGGERQNITVNITVLVTIEVNIEEININQIFIENNYYFNDGYVLSQDKKGQVQIKGNGQGLDTLKVYDADKNPFYLEVDFSADPPTIRSIHLAKTSTSSSTFPSSSSLSSSAQSSSSENISSTSLFNSSSMESSSSEESSSSKTLIDTLDTGYAQQLFRISLDSNYKDQMGKDLFYLSYGEPTFENIAPLGVDYSASFDGTGFSEISFDSTHRQGFPYSISIWLYPRSPINGGDAFCTDIQDGNYYGYRVGINADGKAAMTYGTGVGGALGRRTADGSINIAFDTFTHVVYIFKGIYEFEIWVNGVKDTGLTFSGISNDPIAFTQGNALIGGHAVPPFPYIFNGLVSDIRGFKGILHPIQIQSLKNGL